MKVEKKYINIGVYDPTIDDFWPGEMHYDDGVYLSENYRLCKMLKAAKFESEQSAREFFSKWKHKSKYRMHLVTLTYWDEVPDPVFPEWHPRTKIKTIMENEKSNIHRTALLWFTGLDPKEFVSAPTFKKHRHILLKYDVDISQMALNILGGPLVKECETKKDNKPFLINPDNVPPSALK